MTTYQGLTATETSVSTTTETETRSVTSTTVEVIITTEEVTATQTLTVSATALAGPPVRNARRRARTKADFAQITGSPSLASRSLFLKGSVPPYITACKDVEDYALACLCFGVKPDIDLFNIKTKVITSTIVATSSAVKTITTAATLVITTVVTETQISESTIVSTTTTTSTQTNTVQAQVTQLVGFRLFYPLENRPIGRYGASPALQQNSNDKALDFSLTSTGTLYLTGSPANTVGLQRFGPENGYFRFSQESGPLEPVRCGLDQQNILSCSTLTPNTDGRFYDTFYDCGSAYQGIVFLGSQAQGDPCEPYILRAGNLDV